LKNFSDFFIDAFSKNDQQRLKAEEEWRKKSDNLKYFEDLIKEKFLKEIKDEQ
jgi:hypothetical protein